MRTLRISQMESTHSVIVHERNFVDPIEPGVHTQLIENTWMRAKQKLRR